MVSNDAVGLKVERVTDGTGRFFVPALPVGEYALTAELTGFKRFAERAWPSRSARRSTSPVTLEIGQLTDTDHRRQRSAAAHDRQRRDRRDHRQPPGRNSCRSTAGSSSSWRS